MILTIGKLIDEGKVVATNGFSSGQHNQDGNGTAHMRPFNVTTLGAISLDQIKSVPTQLVDDHFLLKTGDVLFNNTNTEDLVGKTAYWSLPGKFAFSNHMTRIRVGLPDLLSARFLAYALLHRWQMGESKKLCRQHVAQASIMGERFREISIPDIRKPEQDKTAAVLWKVQRAVQAEEKLVAATRELKQSAMRQLFSHGLRGEQQKATPFGEAPKSWEIKALSKWAYVQGGATKGRMISPAEAIDVPYLRVANVQDGHLDLSEMKTIRIRRDELDGYRLQKDDVVLTEGGDFDKLGRGFIWEGQIETCIHQNHIFAVRVNRDRLWPRFFAYLAQSPYGKAYFLTVAHKTTNLACINTTKLRAFPALRPELDEQKEIASILQTLDRRISVHERKRAALSHLFQTLLHQLMTAEIRLDKLDIDTSEVTA